MTGSDIIAGWSLGLCALFICAAGLCGWTALDMRRDASPRRVAFVACVAGFMISLALWQGDASFRWLTGQWNPTTLTLVSFLWRILATVFLFGMIATTSYPRCGHRGWIVSGALFAVTVAAGVVYAAVT